MPIPVVRALASRLAVVRAPLGRWRLRGVSFASARAGLPGLPLLPSQRTAAAIVAQLPAYQVALWPDGWLLEADGAVRVQDTHALAEARRWYRAAARNVGSNPGNAADRERLMGVHGVFVPRALVDLPGCRFASEQVASVALQLLAGDWIAQRRRLLLAAPRATLHQRALVWTGSRHVAPPDLEGTRTCLAAVLRDCVAEGLLPDAPYAIELHPMDGWGIVEMRAVVTAPLSPAVCQTIAVWLTLALLPWNRAVLRDGVPTPLISVRVSGVAR